MTTNTPLHDDPAMRRVQQTINRSAGQHLRAIRKPATFVEGTGTATAPRGKLTPVESEGTRSARAILGESVTSEPLLLNRLHRVDTVRDLPADTTGVAIGHAALPVATQDSHHWTPQGANALAKYLSIETPEDAATRARTWRAVIAVMTIFGALIGYAIWSALQ